MNLKLIFIAVWWRMVVADYSGHYCNPVINILGGSHNCSVPNDVRVSTEFQSEQVREMFLNVSTTLLDKYEQRFEAFLGTLVVSSKPRDCQDIESLGHHRTGVYVVYPARYKRAVRVRCDMDTAGGGWTVIQRRVSDSDFYYTWDKYQIGFGNLSENFWLGNQLIYLITTHDWYELRVDLTNMDNETAHATYQVFSIGDAESRYRLFVDSYSGDAGDSLTEHSGAKFSTHDRDYDTYEGNCAMEYTGAWWYTKCHSANLNGDYGNTAYAKGPVWRTWTGYNAPLKATEMKIRRWRPPAVSVSTSP